MQRAQRLLKCERSAVLLLQENSEVSEGGVGGGEEINMPRHLSPLCCHSNHHQTSSDSDAGSCWCGAPTRSFPTLSRRHITLPTRPLTHLWRDSTSHFTHTNHSAKRRAHEALPLPSDKTVFHWHALSPSVVTYILLKSQKTNKSLFGFPLYKYGFLLVVLTRWPEEVNKVTWSTLHTGQMHNSRFEPAPTSAPPPRC